MYIQWVLVGSRFCISELASFYIYLSTLAALSGLFAGLLRGGAFLRPSLCVSAETVSRVSRHVVNKCPSHGLLSAIGWHCWAFCW